VQSIGAGISAIQSPSTAQATVQNPSHLYSGIGTYTVKLIVKNAAGCIDSITYTLEVTEEYTYYIPNAFYSEW